MNFLNFKNLIFWGGFVRDYLIRGESFNDIDIDPSQCEVNLIDYLDNNYSEFKTTCNFFPTYIINNYKIQIVHLNGKEGFKPIDLSCNIFGFKNREIVPLDFPNSCDFEEHFNLILKKEMYLLSKNDIRRAKKFQERGWKINGFKFHKEENAKVRNVWENYNQIARKRFDKIVNIN